MGRAAKKLPDEFGFKANTVVANIEDSNDLWELVHHTYNKYHEFTDVRKDLFRRSALANGTELCIIAAVEIDDDWIRLD